MTPDVDGDMLLGIVWQRIYNWNYPVEVIHSECIQQYLLNAYYMPGIIMSARDAEVIK